MLQVNPDTPKYETSDSLPPVLDFDEKRRKQGVRIFKYLSWIDGLVAVSVFIVAYTTGAPLSVGFKLIVGMVAAYLVLPLTIDRFRSPDTIIAVALIWLVALLTVATVYYGGFTAAALPWYCAIPIFAYYYLSGWRLVSVLVAVGVGFAIVSLLVALGIVSREMAVANSTDADYGIAFGFLLIYISVASYLFRKGEQEARVALNTALVSAVEARQKADEANAAKSKFLKSMSDELRTPLNALVGFSDVMRRMTVSPDNNAKFNMYSEDMFSSAKHLSKLVDDVLNYTALGSGAFKV
jgi:signal transduction histidine kinase